MSASVSIAKIAHYEEEGVLSALRECLAPLGGMEAFVKKGQRVLLKPNLLGAFPPERAVTTHPAVVRAAAILALEQGASVLAGDSPGFGDVSGVMRRCGITQVLQPLG